MRIGTDDLYFSYPDAKYTNISTIYILNNHAGPEVYVIQNLKHIIQARKIYVHVVSHCQHSLHSPTTSNDEKKKKKKKKTCVIF